MKLEEWTEVTKKALEEAGYSVTLYEDFPLVEIPKSIPEGVKLLKLELPLGGCKTLYSNGCLVTPGPL